MYSIDSTVCCVYIRFKMTFMLLYYQASLMTDKHKTRVSEAIQLFILK